MCISDRIKIKRGGFYSEGNQMKHTQAVMWSAGVGVVMTIMSLHATNAVHDIFHHKGTKQQVELGKVVLYLQAAPHLSTHTTEVDASMRELCLVLPATTASKKLLHFKGEQRCDAGLTLYCVTMREGGAKKNELQLLIQYDAKRVILEYAFFDSISQQKGLIIRFHNKELLDCMKKQEVPVLRVASGKPCVVIDPGHGGHDHGAVSSDHMREKDITLAVGKQIAALLSGHGITVYLTRDTDVFVPLDIRTSFANERDAQFFVSIHVNTSKRLQASGIESHYMMPDLFSGTVMSDTAYRDVVHAARAELCNASCMLARTVHKQLLHNVNQLYGGGICDRQTKQSVGQVLVGSGMPSVLVELGFLSNEEEKRRLASARYQCAAAEGIAQSIIASLS
jgi:N-acetylmuramoyl-L-alanine amidase